MISRLPKWIIVNGSFAGLLYLGAFEHQQWAVNIFVWLVGFFAVLTFLTALTVVDGKKGTNPVKERWSTYSAWYRYLDYGYDMALILVMVGVGWMWSSIAYTFTLLLVACMRHQGEFRESQ